MTPPEDAVNHRNLGGARVTTTIRKRRFLEELKKHPNVTAAAERAGVDRKRVYEWRDDDPSFAAAWDQLLEAAVDRIEASMFDRATNPDPGERDTTAAIFMLKQWRPKRYRETIRYELVQQEARRLADAYGLDADELIREAEAIAQGHERP